MHLRIDHVVCLGKIGGAESSINCVFGVARDLFVMKVSSA